MNPLLIFLIYYTSTFIGFPLIQIINNQFRYKVEYTDEAYIYGLFYHITFIIIVILTYFLITHKKIRSFNVFEMNNWEGIDNLTKIFSRLFLLLPSLFITLYFYKFIIGFGYSDYLANRIIFLSGKGYFVILLLILIPYFLMEIINLYFNRIKNNKKIRISYVIFLFLIASFPGVILGSRTNLLLPYLLFVLSYVHLKNKGTLFFNIKLIIPLLIFIGLLNTGFWLESYRQSLMSGINVESSGLIKSIAGGFGTAENIFWWYDYAGNKVFYGSTLISVFVGLIPRSIWPDKPFGGGPVFTNTMYPGIYDQSASNISSLTTGFPFEFMMNFGFFGSIMGGFIFGIALAIIYYYRRKINNPINYVIWLMLTFSILMYLHSEVFGATSKLLGLVLPLLIIQELSKMFRKRSLKNEQKQNEAFSNYCSFTKFK